MGQGIAAAFDGHKELGKSGGSGHAADHKLKPYTDLFVLRIGLLLPAVLLAGCYRGPDWYAVPEQRAAVTAPKTELAMHIAMNHPNATAHIVRDVNRTLEDNSYRWTHRRPELQFWVEGPRRVKFTMDFALPEATMKMTGPVTLSFFINGQHFDTARYDQPGSHRYEKDAPPELLKPHAKNTVAIEPDKVWVSPDNVALGFVLTQAGFRY
jgi:hypothetical protein